MRQSAPANGLRAGALALAACAGVFAMAAAGTRAALAIPPPRTPEPGQHAASPAPLAQSGATLPLDSGVFFVLDDSISSHSTKPGTLARAHLRDALVVNGHTVAAAGTPVRIEVLKVDPAQIGNVDGSVDIYFQPLALPGGKTLPLHTPTEHIDPHVSAGQASTRGIADTVEDIVIPYHYLYHVLRKGMEINLRPGTEIRARTAALVGITPTGQVVITTPPPFSVNADKPAAGFKPVPLWTPPGLILPSPKPSPSAAPTPTAKP